MANASHRAPISGKVRGVDAVGGARRARQVRKSAAGLPDRPQASVYRGDRSPAHILYTANSTLTAISSKTLFSGAACIATTHAVSDPFNARNSLTDNDYLQQSWW